MSGGGATWIVHACDCLDPVTGLASLPEKSVDVAIFDPPYSQHVHANSKRGARAEAAARLGDTSRRANFSRSRDLGFEAITDEVMRAAAYQVARVTKRWMMAFSDIESCHLWRDAFEAAGSEYIRTGKWNKIGAAPQFTGDRPGSDFEVFTIAHAPGKKQWNGGGRAASYDAAIVLDRGQLGGEKRVHTTQKPLALMEAMLRDFSNPGELVLDPFAGSGTTGVAAIRLGRRFVGWERDPKYVEIARKRIGAAREQLELLVAEAP